MNGNIKEKAGMKAEKPDKQMPDHNKKGNLYGNAKSGKGQGSSMTELGYKRESM